MSQEKNWYVRSAEGKVYGPADIGTLIEWAKEGRIDPTGFVSSDRVSWTPAQLMAELEMKWIIEAEPGKFYGPYNRNLLIRLAANGGLPTNANFYRKHELPVDQDPEPITVEVEKIVEKIVEVEKVVEVEKIVEIEKIVERIVEVEPPARKVIVGECKTSALSERPPVSTTGGVFKGLDSSKLAVLEAAAQREILAAKGGKSGGISNFFSRRKS